MAPPTLGNLGLRHILVRAPVISSGGSLDKALWKDISVGPPAPHPASSLSSFRFPPSPRTQEDPTLLNISVTQPRSPLITFPRKLHLALYPEPRAQTPLSGSLASQA